MIPLRELELLHALWALAKPSDPTELSRSAAASTDPAPLRARAFLDLLVRGSKTRSAEVSSWSSAKQIRARCALTAAHVWLRDGMFYIPSEAI